MNAKSRSLNNHWKLNRKYIFKISWITILLLQAFSGCDLVIPLKPTANIKEIARINGENKRALAVGIEDHYGFFCYLESESRFLNLDIYDLKKPWKPLKISSLNNIPLCEYGWHIHNILIRENFLYINSPDGLVIIDVHDQQNPTVCSAFPISSRDPRNHPIRCRLALKEPYLFLADDSLLVFDVSDKYSPKLLASYPKFRCHDVEVADSLLLLSSGGVRIVSHADPNNLKLITERVSGQEYFDDLALYGQFVFLLNSVMESTEEWYLIYNFEKNNEIKFMGTLGNESGLPDWMTCDLRINSNKAFIGGFDLKMYLDDDPRNMGLYVLDISDINSIQRIAYFKTPAKIADIAVKGVITILAVEGESFLILQTDF